MSIREKSCREGLTLPLKYQNIDSLDFQRRCRPIAMSRVLININARNLKLKSYQAFSRLFTTDPFSFFRDS